MVHYGQLSSELIKEQPNKITHFKPVINLETNLVILTLTNLVALNYYFFADNVVVEEVEGDDGALVEEDLPDESADYFEDYDEPGDSPTQTWGGRG